MDLWNVSRTLTEAYKVWICFGGLSLLMAWTVLKPNARQAILMVLVVLATANYFRWGPDSLMDRQEHRWIPAEGVGGRIDVYDTVHYYLNSKYFDELGYYDLYPAIMLVDLEHGQRYPDNQRYMAQDENGHGMVPIREGFARGRAVRRDNFTPERWKEFEHDFLHLQRNIDRGFSKKSWRMMIQDHGYNGTTVWTTIAEPFANAVSVENLKWLAYLDLILLLGAVGTVAWAYGGVAAGWVWFFLMVTYSLRWPQVGWVFLRYDWLAAMMVCMSLLKKGYPLAAGVFAGYSATLRMFPALWMWGPLAKGLGGLARKKVSKPLLVFAGGFLLGVAVLEAGAVARFGTEQIEIHFENMRDHNDPMQLSSRRVGLALALPYRGELLPKFIEKERKILVEEQKPLRYGLGLLFLLVLGFGLRDAEDDEAYGVGFLAFFLFTTASYYYYAARVTLALLHARDLSKPVNRIGLMILVAIELFTNWAETNHPGHRVFLVGWLSMLMLLYTIFITFWFVSKTLRQPADDADDSGSETADSADVGQQAVS